jgi:phosphoribosylformylglycinamidine synthase
MKPRPTSNGQGPTSEDQRPKAKDQNHTADLLKLLASGNIASKQWVYRQYDHMVRTNTAILPGADAAVVRIKETRRALAMTLDGNGRYCAANPREGAKLVVAEAARNVICVGARPVAITNCLNFASPEKPEVMWSFSEVVDGMAEACRAFGTPVVSGNVSFYNETEGRGILPTPVIGMVGLIEDVRRVVQPGFKKEGDIVVLLGTTEDDLSLSEYRAVCVDGNNTDLAVPKLDLDRELRVQRTCVEASEAGLLQSAHDCSDGGLAVALAESCFSTLGRPSIGTQIDLETTLPSAVTLFSESPSRIIVTVNPTNLAELESIANKNNTPFAVIGRVTGTALRIWANGEELIALEVSELETAWRAALSLKLEAEAMVAGKE